MEAMKNAWESALAALFLTLAACASASNPPKQAAATPPQPDQISPSHRYCMFIPRAGELRECYQFAFGRCTVWGGECRTPGWILEGSTPGPTAP